MTRLISLAVVAGMLLAVAQTPDPGTVLDEGIGQYRQGDYEAALLTLDALTRRTPRPPADLLTRAYLYLGAAYVGLEQEVPARQQFKQALKLDKQIQLSAEDFSPRVLRVFEAERKGKKGKALIAGGGIGLGAAAAAVVLLGSSAATVTAAPPTPTPTPTPAPTSQRTQTYSGVVGGGVSDAHHGFSLSENQAIEVSVDTQAAGFELRICRGQALTADGCEVAAMSREQRLSAWLPAGEYSLLLSVDSPMRTVPYVARVSSR